MQEPITKPQATNLALTGVTIQSDEEAAIVAQEHAQEQLAQDNQSAPQAQ